MDTKRYSWASLGLVLLAASGVASPWGPAPVVGDCNHTYKRRLSHPGYQPDHQTSTTCGESSVTIHIKITGEGNFVIVSGEVEGSIAIQIKTPSSCATQKLWIPEDVHDCGTPLGGWHCNPEGRQIPIQLFLNPSPCPEIPTGAALEAFLTGAGIPGRLPNIPLTVPCGELVDVTEQLPPGARFYWTAKATRCQSSEEPVPGTATEAWTSPDGVSEVLGLFGATVQGGAGTFDFGALAPSGETVGGVVTLSGLAELQEVLAPLVGPADVPLVEEIRGSYAPLDWIDHLRVEVSSSTRLANGEWLAGTNVFSGSFRADGDFHVTRAGLLEQEGARPLPYAVHYTRVGGDVFSSLDGGNSSMVHLAANGGATLVMQGPLAELEPVLRWVAHPLGLAAATYVRHELVPGEEPDRLALHQSFAVEFADDLPPLHLSRALLGYAWRYVVDVSAAARVLSAERFQVASGNVQRRIEFASHAELAPGIWRPMEMTIHDLDPDGAVRRTLQYRFSGGRRANSSPLELRVPSNAENSWFVRVR